MSKEEMFKELADAIISCKKDVVVAAVNKAKGQGIAPAEIIEKGLAAGMNAHLAKPIEPEKMYGAIAKQLFF